jgi:hypothetical protein
MWRFSRLSAAESFRVLKQGGVIRITTPNIQLYWEAYRGRDIYFNYHYGEKKPMPYGQNGNHSRENMALWMVQEVASQLMAADGSIANHSPFFKTAMQAEKYLDGSLEASLSRLDKLIDFKLQREAVGHHVSWWTAKKLESFLRRAGFSNIVFSGLGGSVSPVMRYRNFFDIKIPTASLFMEAIR